MKADHVPADAAASRTDAGALHEDAARESDLTPTHAATPWS